MRKIIFILILTLSFPMSAWCAYPPEVEKSIEDRAMKGQIMIFARDYEGAMAAFKELEKDYPEHPVGYFGQMAVLEMSMLEREDFDLGSQFEAIAKKGHKAIVKTLNRRPSDFSLLVCGSLMGLEGFYKARGKHWWDAYTLGVKSRQTFKRIKRRNPKFYDADFGLGMYLYWRSVFIKDLSFLSIFPDRREEGIAIVKTVIEKGSFAKDLAEVNLGMMWMEEKRFNKAHDIFSKYSSRYPNNILLYMFDSRSLIAARRYDEAVVALRKMQAVDNSLVKSHYFIGLARVLQKNPEHYDEAEKELKIFERVASKGEWKAAANYYLGKLEELRGNKAKAKQYYEVALRHNPSLKKLKLRIRGLGSGL